MHKYFSNLKRRYKNNFEAGLAAIWHDEEIQKPIPRCDRFLNLSSYVFFFQIYICVLQLIGSYFPDMPGTGIAEEIEFGMVNKRTQQFNR